MALDDSFFEPSDRLSHRLARQSLPAEGERLQAASPSSPTSLGRQRLIQAGLTAGQMPIPQAVDVATTHYRRVNSAQFMAVPAPMPLTGASQVF